MSSFERYRCPTCSHVYTAFEFYERLEDVDGYKTRCKNCGEVAIYEDWIHWDGDEI